MSKPRKNAHVPQLYECEVCKKVFNKKSNFQRHLLIHSALPVVREPHVCPHCSFNASTSSSLKVHIKRIHTKEYNHICSVCNKGYVLARELQRHVKNHHPSINDVYVPVDVGKNEDKDDSKNFPLMETPSDPIVLEPKESSAPQSPPTVKSYQCEHCERVFIRKSNLNKHLVVHSEGYVEKDYVCPHCHFKACSSSSLHIHLRRIHTKEFRHVCPHCSKGFAVPSELRRHIEFRHSEKTDAVDIIKIKEEGLMCEVCNRLLTSLSEVEEHRKRHHNMLAEKKHHCMQCDYSTNYKGDLKRHLRYHLGDRRFPCEFCDKAFVEKGPLKIHLRMHTGESPFVCTTCGRRFKRHCHLEEHERTHSGVKPYLCDICSKRFTTKTGFNLHKCKQQSKTVEVLSVVSQDFPIL